MAGTVVVTGLDIVNWLVGSNGTSKSVDCRVGAVEKKPPKTEMLLWLRKPGMRITERLTRA